MSDQVFNFSESLFYMNMENVVPQHYNIFIKEILCKKSLHVNNLTDLTLTDETLHEMSDLCQGSANSTMEE